MKSILIAVFCLPVLACSSSKDHGDDNVGKLDGHTSTGGGMIVQCTGDAGSARSIELLDVYEAKSIDGRTLIRPSGDLKEDYLRLTKNTYQLQGAPESPLSDAELLKNLTAILDIIEWSDKPLPFLNDQGTSEKLPAGCELKQIAIFYDGAQKVVVDKNLWVQLDSLNKAALIKHEVWYHYERLFRENTSESTRSYVGQILTQSGLDPVLKDVDGASLRCWAVLKNGSGASKNAVTVFYVHKVANDFGTEDVLFQFESLAGRPLLVLTTSETDNLLFEVERKLTRSGEMFAVPVSSTVNKTIKMPINSSHRSDWDIVLNYKSGEPVTIKLLQDDVPLSESVLHHCE